MVVLRIDAYAVRMRSEKTLMATRELCMIIINANERSWGILSSTHTEEQISHFWICGVLYVNSRCLGIYCHDDSMPSMMFVMILSDRGASLAQPPRKESERSAATQQLLL